MRLTARSPKNNMAYLVNVKPDEQDVESPYSNTLRCIMDSFEKLAKYEETSLEPQEIQQLQEQNRRMRDVALMISKYANPLDLDKQHFAEFTCLLEEVEKAGDI